MAFVGLGVVFCALAALSRRGASRLARLDAQLAAARGVRDVEAGDFGGASSRSDPCAVGDVVSLIRRGVRVQGTGVVTRADARRDSYRVRWSRELSDTFTYRPVAGGPLLRARRRPGPKRGWRREDLLLETPPAAAGGGRRRRRASALGPHTFRARVGGPVAGDVAPGRVCYVSRVALSVTETKRRHARRCVVSIRLRARVGVGGRRD
jgi:hypothetical protein